MLRLDGCKVSRLVRIGSFSRVKVTSEDVDVVVVVVVNDVARGSMLSALFLVDYRSYTSKVG